MNRNLFHDPERDDYDEGQTPREDFVHDPKENTTVPLTALQQIVSRLTTLGLLCLFLTVGSPLALCFSIPAAILGKIQLFKIDKRGADPSNRRVIESNFQSATFTTIVSLIISSIVGLLYWLS